MIDDPEDIFGSDDQIIPPLTVQEKVVVVVFLGTMLAGLAFVCYIGWNWI